MDKSRRPQFIGMLTQNSDDGVLIHIETLTHSNGPGNLNLTGPDATYTQVVDPLVVFPVFGAVIGLLFGSFLNVCIARLPKHESIVAPRSRCPECQAPIRWYDNIPLLSWLVLRGRCRDCKARISVQYPIVELLTGLWFARAAAVLWAYWHIGGGVEYTASQSLFYSVGVLGFAILGFLLIGLMVMDWQTLVLPDAFTLIGIAIALFLICTQSIFLGPHEGDIILNTTHQLRMSSPGSNSAHGNLFMTGTEALIWGRVAAIVGAGGLLMLVRWLYKLVRKREGLGMGDVKLIAMIAAFLGFWPAILALFIGVLSATAYALLLLARGRANRLTRLPLGSFLAAGGLVAALFGTRLIDMYSALLR
jgi:leader peptidase (prepilin peptidase)/N-methyltransferase